MIILPECADPRLNDDLSFGVGVLNQATGCHNLLTQCTGHILGVYKSFALHVPQITGIQINLTATERTKIKLSNASIHSVAHH